MPDPREAALVRLKADELLAVRDGRVRTTRRWQSAMARAASRLFAAGDAGEDLRVPVASALLELYGDSVGEEEIVGMLAVILPIEQDELRPKLSGSSAAQT